MPVVVAARDLAPGTTVTPDDLVVADVPEQARSVDSTADPTTLVGRRVVVPLLAGDAVLARHLLTASLLAGYGAGTVATPLRLADASALALLRPGDLVDVIAASSVGAAGAASDSATVVASRVRVLLAGTAAASGLVACCRRSRGTHRRRSCWPRPRPRRSRSHALQSVRDSAWCCEQSDLTAVSLPVSLR